MGKNPLVQAQARIGFRRGTIRGRGRTAPQNLAALTAYTEETFRNDFECVPVSRDFCQ